MAQHKHTGIYEISGLDGGSAAGTFAHNAAVPIGRIGRVIALAGIVIPLLLIGGLKFTQYEVEGLKRLV